MEIGPNHSNLSPISGDASDDEELMVDLMKVYRNDDGTCRFDVYGCASDEVRGAFSPLASLTCSLWLPSLFSYP